MNQERIETYANNLLWYTGEYDRTQEYRVIQPGVSETTIPRKLLPRIFNQLYELTEQRVSRLSRYKADFQVMPKGLQQTARIRAKLYDSALHFVANKNKFDNKMMQLEKQTAIFGECYLFLQWDKNAGDRVDPKKIDREGDITITIKPPWSILLEPKDEYEKVTWALELVDVLHVEEARKKYKSSLEPDNRTSISVSEFEWHSKRPDELVVYRLWQRPTEFLPEGAVTTFCGGQVVEELDEYPYSHFGFPFLRHTDIDVPGRLHALSFYQHLKPVQHVYNRLTSIITRNILLCGHPHLVTQEGTFKVENFTNGPTVMKYAAGGRPPEALTFKAVTQEQFAFLDRTKAEMEQLSNVSGVSRGNPPSGTRAESMLRFYEEQEEQRNTTAIAKRNELIRHAYLMMGSIANDYYPQGDIERLVRIIGEENQELLEEFIDTRFVSEYDVEIINSTGFSRSMTGRLEEIRLINEIDPALLTPEQKADVLELRNPTKAYDVMTSSLRTAELYCQQLLAGRDVPQPRMYWDLIVHWRQMMIMLNSSAWQLIPEDVEARALDHLLVLEVLMADKAAQNPVFAQKLAALDMYPVVHVLPPTPAPPMPPEQQGAPAGDMGGQMQDMGTMPEGGAPMTPEGEGLGTTGIGSEPMAAPVNPLMGAML